MQVSVETLEGLQRKMTVQLPAEKVNEIVDNKLRSIAREVRLDGFRPGKVPLKVVKKRFGAHVRQEAYGELIQSTFYEAASGEKLNPAGEPSIEVRDDENGFSYTAEFEVVPEVTLNDLSAATLERVTGEITDSDVEEMLEKLRKQRVTWNQVERPAQDGDQVTVSFVGKVDGEEFEGGSAQNVPVELGAGRMIEGFEQGLLGASAGEERTIEVNFPEDYQAENLAGKPATFEISINEVAEPVLPELDDEFARAFGVEEGGIDKLKSDIRENMQREMAQKLNATNKEKVMDLLLENNDFAVPQAMIDSEAQRLKEETKQQMQGQQGQSSSVDLPLDIFREQAERRVKLGMLVAAIVDEHKLEVDEGRVRTTVENFAASYESPQELLDWYYADNERLNPVRNVVLEDQVVDWVTSQVNVTDKQTSFQELT
ncbi:MAG: trigger factor [Gammaproteobacteria bacterium]|jgi:trigger factor